MVQSTGNDGVEVIHRCDWVFQTGCFASGSTRNDWGPSRPCILPPVAVKSKPPAMRVVVDSEKNNLNKEIWEQKVYQKNWGY
jgi:hypothetical protein